MSGEEGMQVSLPPRPVEGNLEAWKTYWEARGQPWRTEPEISPERQAELAQYRAIVPNIQKGLYPFKGMKLNRADTEWLLATHESGGMQGPVNWNDGCQRERRGLDLRGANLSQENLEGLPLAGTLGGVMERTWIFTPEEQRTMAAVCMEKATLVGAQLQGAPLVGAQLQGANLGWAQLQGATLRGVELDSGSQKDPILHEETYRPALLADATWDEVNLAVIMHIDKLIRTC